MSIGRWTILAFLSAAAAFLAVAVWKLVADGRYASFPPGNLILAAGYSLLCGFLLHTSKGLHRRIMLIASFGLFLGYVFRLLVLASDDTLFDFSHWDTLSAPQVTNALLFLTVGTCAFWFGTRLTTPKINLAGSRNDEGKESLLFHYRHVLLVVSIVIASVIALLGVVIGVGLPNALTGRVGYVARLLPIEVLPFLISFVLLRYWRNLTPAEKVAFFSFFLLLFLTDFMAGKRSSFFRIPVTFLFTYIWIRGEFQLSVKWVLSGVVMFAGLAPLYFGVVMFVRDYIYSDHTLLEILDNMPKEKISEFNLQTIGVMITNRFAAVDHLIAVMNFKPPGLEKYLGLSVVSKSIINALAPGDAVEWVPSLGKLFGVFYQGHGWELRHSGAWGGFGVCFAYFDWFGGIALGVWGAFVGCLIRWFQKSALSGTVLAPYLLSMFVFSFFLSGNLDLLISQLISNSVLFVLIFRVLTFIGKPKIKTNAFSGGGITA